MFSRLAKTKVYEEAFIQLNETSSISEKIQTTNTNEISSAKTIKNLEEPSDLISKANTSESNVSDSKLENTIPTVPSTQINFFLRERKKLDFENEILTSGSKSSNINLEGKISGIRRNLFEAMDLHKLFYKTQFFSSEKRSSLKWVSRFPFILNDATGVKLILEGKSKMFDEVVREKTMQEKIRVLDLDKNWKVDVKKRFLQNYFNVAESSAYEKEYLFNNCTSHILKVSKVLVDEVYTDGLTPDGVASKISLAFFLNDNFANSLKMNFDLKMYYSHTDPNNWLTSKFKYVNVEHDTKIGFCLRSSNKRNVNLFNDYYVPRNVRGFASFKNKEMMPNSEKHRNFTDFQAIFLQNFKVNFYDYPLLSYFKIFPFLNFTFFAGVEDVESLAKYRNLKRNEKIRLFIDEFGRGSFGVGLRRNVLGSDIEFLFNLLHFSKHQDKQLGFQIILNE